MTAPKNWKLGESRKLLTA